MVAKSSPPGGVRKVRGSVRPGPAMRQTSKARQVEKAAGDPFEALAGGETGPTSPGSIRIFALEIDTITCYWHRDLKHPVIVRGS
jgi:hypothetical protein